MPETTYDFGATIGQLSGSFALACLGLLVFGFLFNLLTAEMHRRGYSEGFTWLLVVIGTTVVLAVSVPFVGLADILILFMLFASAGLPMAAGDIWRYLKAKEGFEKRQRESV